MAQAINQPLCFRYIITMRIYKIENRNIKPINTETFDFEKEIRKVFENNLDELFSLTFVKSEFKVKNVGIDTLGFDEELNAFTIIEYKRRKNSGIVDQGLAYLSILLNNKSDFIVEYQSCCKD